MKPKTILIVDDSAEIREILSTALSIAGYGVLTARDGQEGVKLARKAKPDAILMDCLMPVMDGWQACRQIREAPETRHIPVIMCTSRDSMQDVEKSLEAGATDYLPKPIDLDRLTKGVQRALAGFRLSK